MTTNDYQWLHSGYILTISDNILATFWLHFGYILATLRLHSDYILTTHWLHFCYILTAFLLHSDYILTTFWLNADYILTKLWLNYGYISAIRLHSDYILSTLWLHSGYSLATFRLHSYYILTTFVALSKLQLSRQHKQQQGKTGVEVPPWGHDEHSMCWRNILSQNSNHIQWGLLVDLMLSTTTPWHVRAAGHSHLRHSRTTGVGISSNGLT